MGTIVIHAGMPKTGSTSIQRWLAGGARTLRAEHKVQVLVARSPAPGRPRDELTLAPPRLAPLEAGRIAKLYDAAGARRDALDERLLAQLDSQARHAPVTVVSSEALARGLHHLGERFLAGLGELGGRHRVRVAYYVRPQDAALEAHWRQWGFRSDQEPSRFVALRSRQLDYVATLTGVRERAPGVSFEIRPFRRDLLHAGDIVADFAHHFLGIERAGSLRRSPEWTWDNRGLPLDIANALRTLPEGLLWTHGHGNRRLDALRRMVARFDLPESEAARSSRLVLRGYAHERFEVGNRQLIRELDWPTASFVPAVGVERSPLAPDELESLDELWRAEPAQRHVRAVIRAALSARERRPVAGRG